MSIETLKNGLFLVIEGQDGVGKSTQTKLLVERLREAGYDVVQTHEVGGTEFGKVMRGGMLNHKVPPASEILAAIAARVDHYEKVVKPALAENKIVVSDRGVLSTWALNVYPHIAGTDTSDPVSQNIADIFAGTSQCIALKPEPVTIILDTPYEYAKARYAGEERDDYERDEKRMELAAKCYVETAASCIPGDIALIAVNAVGTIDEVSDRLYEQALLSIKKRAELDFPPAEPEPEATDDEGPLPPQEDAPVEPAPPADNLEQRKAEMLDELRQMMVERTKDVPEDQRSFTDEDVELIVSWYKNSIDVHATDVVVLPNVHHWAAGVALNSLLSYNFFTNLKAGKA